MDSNRLVSWVSRIVLMAAASMAPAALVAQSAPQPSTAPASNCVCDRDWSFAVSMPAAQFRLEKERAAVLARAAVSAGRVRLGGGLELILPDALQITVIGGARQSFLGVDVCELERDRVRALNLKDERGVEITHVQEDSPASKAGLKSGDVVVEYNGQRVEGTEQFIRLVRETPAGREVKIGILRNGQPQTLTATIAARKSGAMMAPMPPEGWGHMLPPEMPPMPVMPDMPQVFTAWRSPYMGIEAESLTPQLAEYFGAKQGVLVRSVRSGTPAEKAGLKAGDVITRIDGEAVSSPAEITNTIRGLRNNKKTFPVTLVREHREMTVNVTIDQESPDSSGKHVAPASRRVSAGDKL